MNLSGQAVVAAAYYYRIMPEEILIAHDELDFPAGKVRIKFGGGHGGHNGLRDTIQHLGSKDFYRLRIGINHPGDRNRVSQYVLSQPSQTDTLAINRCTEDATAVLDLLTQGDIDKAIFQLHSENS